MMQKSNCASNNKVALNTQVWKMHGENIWNLFSFPSKCFAILCVHACLVAQPCPTLYDPMDCSLPGSSVHGDSPGKNTGVGRHAFLQGIFPTQDWTLVSYVSCTSRWVLYHCVTWEAQQKRAVVPLEMHPQAPSPSPGVSGAHQSWRNGKNVTSWWAYSEFLLRCHTATMGLPQSPARSL